jgi:Cu-Zn family superoxide dismutase
MKALAAAAVGLSAAVLASAAPAGVDRRPATTLYAINDDGVGDPIGSIRFDQTARGLVLITRLTGLTPGVHGIHIHQTPDCSALVKDGKSTAGLGAGGHFDPAKTGKHLGPAGDGHQGDLPTLLVGANGAAYDTLVAPHLTLADIKGHAVVIHAGGDNYSDEPKPLGGGGARIACGVIE